MPIDARAASTWVATVGSFTAATLSVQNPTAGIKCVAFEITSDASGNFSGTIPSINGKVLRAYGIADGVNNPSGGFLVTFTEAGSLVAFLSGANTLTGTAMSMIQFFSSLVTAPYVMLFGGGALVLTASGMGNAKKARIILFVED